MPSNPIRQRLAKLAPPGIRAELRRERLFSLLGKVRDRPLVWVSGPPGAGKTTLIAGYAEECKALGLWYQVDKGDNDPASFFHYLAQGVRQSRGRQPLPFLSPEYLRDLETFGRRFFRDFFARLPASSLVVLDNYQEVSLDSPFHELIALAADEAPPGLVIVVISRASPPAALARHTASGRVARLGWQDLRLTFEETAAIARLSGVSDPSALELLHATCDGWAGGLRLLIEESKGVESLQAMAQASPPDSVFDYFANQVFARMPEATQRFLSATWVLPRMTAVLAQELSGEQAAGRVLEDLYRRHLFTDRRAGEQITYQFHSLFRLFLRERALRTRGESTYIDLQRRAAVLLERAGMLEDAVEVNLDAGNWVAVTRLIREHGARLLEQGRGQTLRQWIEAVPEGRLPREPALPYWLGTSLIPFDQHRARQALERAYALYERSGDTTGQMLASSGIIEASFLQHSNHGQVDRWLPMHERLLVRAPLETPADVQLRAYASMLITLLYRQPGSAMLEVCAQRVLILLDALEVPANARMSAATFLMWYCGYMGDFRTMRRLLPIGAALARREEVTALHRANWWTWLGYCQHCMLDDAAAEASLTPALALGEEHALPAVAFLASYFLGLVASRMGRFDLATQCLRRMEDALDAQSRIQCAILHAMRGWLSVERALPDEALTEGEAAWEIGASLGSPSYLVHWGTPMIYGLVEAGRLAEARRRLQLQRDALRDTRIRCFDPMLIGIEATIELREGQRGKALELVSDMFRMARKQERGGYLRRLGPWLGDWAALALEADVEVEYVQRLVREAGIPPPSQSVRHWPWKCEVLTLGTLGVKVNGELLRHGRKSPKKPLALLCALAAAGSAGVSEAALCDALWRATDGDAAHHALAIAIHRLRAMLGTSETICVSNGRVRLNDRLVWVDAWAFEAMMDRRDAGDSASSRHALELYAGPFAPEEADIPWVLSTRERVRRKFIRLLSAVADEEESARRYEQAAFLYRRGLEVDDLAEPFCRGLMRCSLALNRVSEGIVAYRNLRQLLSVTLSRHPSAETEAQYRALMGGS